MPAAPAILKMFTDELDDHTQKWDSLCLELANAIGSPQDFDRIPAALQGLFRCAHNLKAGSQIAELDEMAQFLHKLEDYLVLLKDGKIEFVDESLDIFNDAGQYLRKTLGDLSRGTLPLPASIQLAEPVLGKIGRLIIDPVSAPSSEGAKVSTGRTTFAVDASAGHDVTTKVKLSQLDHLIRLIGELSLESASMGSQGRKILKDLQNTALGLRMQTLEGLFAKLEKSAGDTSRRLGKKLAIRKEGLDVELDKQIIEKLSEPLTHMIRNAIDHGLEPAAIRRFTGKSEVGLLRFTATDVGGTVELTIEDDGRGIDAERVFQKAIEKGLISETTILSDNEKRQLIFLPGFSTNETITEFSGRGIGMDVVKTLMDSLGGEIEIESESGKGTRFILKIPATVSVLNALIIQTGDVSYAIPTQDLREVVNLAEHEIKFSSRNQAYFVLRDRVVILRRISEFVRVGQEKSGESAPNLLASSAGEADRPALVVKAGESIVAFPVDRIRSQERLHIRPLNESLKGLGGAIGTAILSGGEPSLILNLQSLVRKISLGA